MEVLEFNSHVIHRLILVSLKTKNSFKGSSDPTGKYTDERVISTRTSKLHNAAHSQPWKMERLSIFNFAFLAVTNATIIISFRERSGTNVAVESQTLLELSPFDCPC